MSTPTIAIAGLGSRGQDTYARYALERGVKIVAAADPDPARLAEAVKRFGLPPERCFATAEELLAQDRLADILFVCTPDDNHYSTAIPALRKGYHLLLEKPAATRESECLEIVRVAQECGRHVLVCHVLRYAPFYGTVKQVIDSGEIGEVVTVNAVENVGYWHHAHSFVRGKWADTAASSPMMLAKCCHDVDILLFLLGRRIRRVSSYGGLYYFRPENAPENAAVRCLGGCGAKASCPYDAEKIYLTGKDSGVLHGKTGWPADVLARPATEENVRRALETGPYGRCVFHCGNDAVDHQVVNLEFDGGATAQLTMSAFSPEIYRTLQVMGTLGQIEGDMRTNRVTTSVFGQTPRTVDTASGGEYGGHGGGDIRMFDALLALVSGGTGAALSSIERSVESHLACFAAERSRRNGGASVEL